MKHLTAISQISVRKAQLEQLLLAIQIANSALAFFERLLGFMDEQEERIEELRKKSD